MSFFHIDPHWPTAPKGERRTYLVKARNIDKAVLIARSNVAKSINGHTTQKICGNTIIGQTEQVVRLGRGFRMIKHQAHPIKAAFRPFNAWGHKDNEVECVELTAITSNDLAHRTAKQIADLWHPRITYEDFLEAITIIIKQTLVDVNNPQPSA